MCARRQIRETIAVRISAIQKKHPRFKPHLAIIQQGSRPDSSLYVRMKAKAAAEANIGFTHLILPEDASEEQVMKAVEELNDNENINGLLVQLPLSNSIGKAGERRITEAVSPSKDVDGFHAYNIGLLSSRASDPLFQPCTPAGSMVLLESTGIQIAGKHAVVLGRSDIVGSPICAMLRRKDATVTQCHSRTQNLPEIVRVCRCPFLLSYIDVAISPGQTSRHRHCCNWPARIRQGRMVEARRGSHRCWHELHPW